MKRIIYLAIALICATSINAQVRIGNNTEPHKGAVLDLKSTETETKGLLLPSVNLTDINSFLPVTGDKDAAAGMVIYNTNETIGKGVYVWDGDKWSKIADSNGNGGDNGGGTGTPATELPKVTITSDKTPASITAGTAVGLTATVTTEGSNTYQWYKNGTALSGETSSTYNIASIALGDYYSCVVTNSQGSATASWSTCGAYIDNNVWLSFMCHNLGADEDANPFAYSNHVLGDLYQWGRKADGHEKRTSSNAAGPVTATSLDGNGQIASDKTTYYGKFVTSTTNDWRDPEYAQLWGSNKTVSDPCPVGWKIPTRDQWAAVYSKNTWTWTGGGYTIGNALYLPAAGGRSRTTAVVGDMTTNGSYWSSTAADLGSFGVYFSSGGVNPEAGWFARANGMSVRCVADN